MASRRRVVVSRFGGPEVLRLEREDLPPRPRRLTRVRVTQFSVGATDALARSGGYLLQPRPGFTPGYDFVGVVEEPAEDAVARGLVRGTRVAACLPRMGAAVEVIDVPSSLLVAVPDGLDSAIAAALPLDLVTAGRALQLARLRRLSAPGLVFVNGITGNIGRIVAQLAAAQGHRIAGTASAASRPAAEALGAIFYDYREDGWGGRFRAEVPGGADAVVDHTGARALRALAAPHGAVVRTSYVGHAGHERRDTLLGSIGTLAAFAARPAERLVSVPLFVASERGAYRAMLATLLQEVATGALAAPPVRLVPFGEAVAAHGALGSDRKTVLVVSG